MVVGIWVFPKIGVPQNGWFVMENPKKMDDLGGTPIFGNTHLELFASSFGAVFFQSCFRSQLEIARLQI